MLKVETPHPTFPGEIKGKPVALGDLWAQGPVVLFFYPKDFTPVCTREACHFRDAYGDLRARGVQVVGVSDDDPESHLRFQEAHQLPYPLLTDEGRAMANAFGLRGTLGLWPRRVTFVIDASGIIRGVFHHELSAKKHVDDALAVLNTDATSRA